MDSSPVDSHQHYALVCVVEQKNDTYYIILALANLHMELDNKGKAREVVLDTNFCLIPVRRKRDIFSELVKSGYKLVILPQVTAELQRIAGKGEGTSVAARDAKTTLRLLEQKGLKTPPSSSRYADTAILAYCRGLGAAAATHDNELRKRLRAAGVPVITLGRSGALKTEE